MIKLFYRVIRGVYNRIKLIIIIIIYVLCRALSKLSKEKLWVICERGTDARDNGFAFYKYMIEKHPEIKLKFLITSHSADYYKVRDHAVEYGSLKHYYILANAEKIISSHCYTAFPVKNEKVWNFLGFDKRFYFLQHGIIQAKLPYLFGNRTRMRFFCSGAIPEKDYLNKEFQHPEGVIQCTGLARYDNLIPYTTKRQILVMPTWRRYINSEYSLLHSKYYDAWNTLLNSVFLIDYLEKSNTKLVFYPHYEMQSYLGNFKSINENVVIADFDHYDVQQLLKESALLITDYSSVFFDFAYMCKPVIYYQFDLEEYHDKHYKEGYFSFEKDGFGVIVENQQNLLKEIKNIIQNNFVMPKEYTERVQYFFGYQDNNNCERIFQAINKL